MDVDLLGASLFHTVFSWKRMISVVTSSSCWCSVIPIGNYKFQLKTRCSSRFFKYRLSQDAWPEPYPSLGRIANFSSLRKHRPAEYNMHDAFFERTEAQPRFIIRPFSTEAAEGQSATFYCRVIGTCLLHHPFCVGSISSAGIAHFCSMV